MTATVCPACGRTGLDVFYEQEAVPTQSCRLVGSRAEAESFPLGAIRLGICPDCGFVANTAFEPGLVDYAQDYEDSQAFSARFRGFLEQQVRDLAGRHRLLGGTVVEIGCGKGDFLRILREVGGVSGIVGIDPAAAGRLAIAPGDRATFLAEPYSERHASLHADLLACRHTLEHIQPVREFVSLVRRNLDGRGTPVFFEVPSVVRILEEAAFWDVYYEHCSYFSPGSLARLFRSCGFEVTRVELAFDDQYLLLEARAAEGLDGAPLPVEEAPETLRALASRFAAQLETDRGRWRTVLDDRRSAGDRIAVWGASSKAVSFLTTLGLDAEAVEYVVDINPHKHGRYMPGTGQEIVAPEHVRERPPGLVVLMNPVYREEVAAELERLGVRPALVAA